MYQLEEQTVQALHPDNFYHGRQLDLQELKNRIRHFKNRQTHTLPPEDIPDSLANKLHPARRDREVEGTAHFQQPEEQHTARTEEAETYCKPTPGQSRITRLQGESKKTSEQPSQMQSTASKPWLQEAAPQHTNHFRPTRYKSRTLYGQTPQLEVPAPSRLQQLREERSGWSKVTENRQRSWDEWGLEHSLQVEDSLELGELETHMGVLWEHYQLVTKILMSLRENPLQERHLLTRYVEEVCSPRFEFLSRLMAALEKENYRSRQEAAFIRRLTRAVVLSRLYETAALAVAALELGQQRPADSFLVNWVGYASSNVVFLLRLMQLTHAVGGGLEFGEKTAGILTTISQFESGSYGGRVARVGQVILRIEQNNEVMGMVQQKVGARLDHRFRQQLQEYLKPTEVRCGDALLAHARALFTLLAAHLSQLPAARFPALHTAPAPYLALSGRTLVIEPWEVLFCDRGNATFVRAYTDLFLSQAAQLCNLVFWTDQQPASIDDLLRKLPPAPLLYRHHCLKGRSGWYKPVGRLGCDRENTVFIDRSESAWGEGLGVALPWKGLKRDGKLLVLWELLLPILKDVSVSSPSPPRSAAASPPSSPT